MREETLRRLLVAKHWAGAITSLQSRRHEAKFIDSCTAPISSFSMLASRQARWRQASGHVHRLATPRCKERLANVLKNLPSLVLRLTPQ